MKKKSLVAPLLAVFFGVATAHAADLKPSAKHTKAGVTCFDCHGEESPSKAAVSDDSCMTCHGDYPAMAAFTKGLAVNPHDPPKKDHPGPFACTECHRQHKAPVVKCLECHPKFKMTAK